MYRAGDPRPPLGYESTSDYVDRARLAQLEAAARRLNEDPLWVATVLDVDTDDEYMIVNAGPGGVVRIRRYRDAEIAPGAQVLVHRGTLQVVSVLADDRPSGLVATVLEVGAGVLEVEVAGARRTVRSSGSAARVGERVVVDPSLGYAIGSLGMPRPAYADAPETSVPWEDVGGHAEAKAALQEAIELAHTHPELYASYGKRPVKGVLLYGPPGTGKTLLAKAAATSLARAYGRQSMTAGGFVYLRGPELINRFLGESEAAIRALFAAAREFRRVHGQPSLVFLDEADALLGDRGRGLNVSINATTVPQFLAEMDGFDDPAAIFLLATNRPGLLDSAVTREGRVDLKVRVGRPSEADAAQIVALHLRGRPLREGLDREVAAARVARRIFDPEVGSELVVRRYGPVQVELRHLVNGALLSRVVEQAATTALRRDALARRASPSGIGLRDLEDALEVARRANADVDHSGVLQEMVEAGAP